MPKASDDMPKTAESRTPLHHTKGQRSMRLKIDTSEVRFRVAGTAKPKMDPRNREQQARTPDGMPVWVVRLTAIEAERGTAETIWVEVVGDEPKLTLDDLVQVHSLAFAPWISGPNRKDHKIVRNFRAEQVTALSDASRRAA
jgi:hypothetical protein